MTWFMLFTMAWAMPSGEYLLRVAGCAHCHTSRWDEPLAGQRRLNTPFGAFYPPNITPDPETGIGKWTLSDFTRALREGVAPDGSKYYPAFPYPSYRNMTDEDVRELFDYIKSLKPIRKARLANELRPPYDNRWLVNFWRLLFFWDSEKPKDRGAYLVRALGHCAECHSPRNSFGALEADQFLAGSDAALEGWLPPNITPDKETGLGNWIKQDWRRFLSSGITPEGKTVGGEMAFVVQSTAALTDADRDAMIEYLMNVPSIRNRVGTP